MSGPSDFTLEEARQLESLLNRFHRNAINGAANESNGVPTRRILAAAAADAGRVQIMCHEWIAAQEMAVRS